jgi:hypothetical protein
LETCLLAVFLEGVTFFADVLFLAVVVRVVADDDLVGRDDRAVLTLAGGLVLINWPGYMV